jgi:hypothetical protein
MSAKDAQDMATLVANWSALLFSLQYIALAHLAVDTLNYIKKAPRVRFTGPRWAAISSAAKDCIRTMLDPTPGLRPTAAQVGGVATRPTAGVWDRVLHPPVISCNHLPDLFLFPCQVLNHEWLRTVAPDVTIKSDLMVHLRVRGSWSYIWAHHLCFQV